MADRPQNGLLRRENGGQIGPLVVAPSDDWVVIPSGTGGATETTLAQVRDRLIEVRDNADQVEAKLDTLIATTPATLTGRMLDKKPTTGYRMWVDPTAATNRGAGVIMAEAPVGSAESATDWRGVFIPTGAGEWVERTAFAWASRTAGW